MKINWKVRLRNKPWVAGLIGVIVTFAYDIMAAFEIVPAVDESHVMSLIKTLLTLLVGLGVLVDPTTQGVSDSERAMMYVEPGKLPDEE